jgi:phenylalanyl-tRNA synthetase beta chain
MRDLAVLVDELAPVGDMVEVIKKAGGDILENVEVFDIYTGSQIEAGKKNVAFNLVFRKHDTTLTQAEVNEVFDSIVAQLKAKYNAELRQ